MLRYGSTGRLELLPETSIAAQQPALPDGGNSVEPLNSGWPAYEFSDGSAAFSGIVRNSNGSSSVVLSSRTIAESFNRLSVEFQDSSNEFQQDSLSLVDAGDSSLIGYEISSQSTALGLANMNQAARVLLRQLDKSTNGNLFVQFQTSFRALKVRPGDIIALTYLKEGLIREPFRVIKLSPSENYQLVTILAQTHNDDWYSDDTAVLAGAGRQPSAQIRAPHPLIGLIAHLDLSHNLRYFDFEVSEQIAARNDGSATDTLTVSFSQPSKPDANALAVPLINLSPQYITEGGSFNGGDTFYYAVSAVDEAGNEGALSFTVPALIPSGIMTSCVSLVGMSFPKNAASFHVYRGSSPQMLYRIASSLPIAGQFTDIGIAPQAIGPPDASFDHANFYYRSEYAGPFTATAFSPTTIACADMGAAALAYSGMTVRIIDGTGFGQERKIATNDQTTLTVNPVWSVTPDATSSFVVCESSWRFAAVSTTTPVQFEIPYQAGSVIQILGRSANVNNLESAVDLCPLTRCPLGAGESDAGTTIAPNFTLTVPGAGELSLLQVGFNDLTNTASVCTGTLQVFGWNELSNPNQFKLAAPLDQTSSTVSLMASGSPHVGQLLQIGSELMTVLSASSATATYRVGRASLGSPIQSHNTNDPVLHLQASTFVVPFGLNFFSNRASMNFIHSITLPDLRICGAQFFVTNAFGDSQATQQCYTNAPGAGLRTLSGGQFSLQVGGSLATQSNATPAMVVQATHAVRDVRAVLNQPAAGYSINVDILQNGSEYCSLTFGSGDTFSNVIDGAPLPALAEGATLNVNLSLSLDPSFSGSLNPGRDLTVVIRF